MEDQGPPRAFLGSYVRHLQLEGLFLETRECTKVVVGRIGLRINHSSRQWSKKHGSRERHACHSEPALSSGTHSCSSGHRFASSQSSPPISRRGFWQTCKSQ